MNDPENANEYHAMLDAELAEQNRRAYAAMVDPMTGRNHQDGR